MNGQHQVEQVETLVIGGGQAGLSVGYHLSQRGLPFLIVDARAEIGETWRARWDSLRLFTPARFNGLDGMPFPDRPHAFPTKNEMADYLAAYADRFELPVRTGVRVDRLAREQNRFTAYAGDRRFEAENVIVAMASYQEPWVPDFAEAVDPGILQMHSAEYRNPRQLRDGPVLLVGAGNSSSEIAMEVATHHEVSMSGRDTGQLPFRIDGLPARVAFVPLVLRVLFHRVLTVSTPIGRKVRPKMLQHGGPLIRVRGKELERAGVTRVPRTIGVRDGMPLLEDGRTLEPANVIWCTGFRPGFHWIDLPIHGRWEPRHRSGIVPDAPGLYFVGLHFLHAMSSTMIHGVGRDAARVVDHIARRRPGQGAHDGNQKREVRVAG